MNHSNCFANIRSVLTGLSAVGIFCFAAHATEPPQGASDQVNAAQLYGNDTRVRFDKTQGGHRVTVELTNVNDYPGTHSIAYRDGKPGTKVLLDHALRYSPETTPMFRLSDIRLWWDRRPIALKDFPTNQLYNFHFNDSYGSWTTYNGANWRDYKTPWLHGVYLSLNADGNAGLVTLCYQQVTDGVEFLWSAILLRPDGSWNIFPPSYYDSYYHIRQKITVLEKGDGALAATDRKVLYEDEQKKRKIKLLLEVEPDSAENHRIERKKTGGEEHVLIDGKPRWYDPATPIQWKLSSIKAWWDDKPVELKNFPENQFFNFPLKKYDLQKVMAVRDKKENGVGIYPSIDGSAVYVAFVRRDANSGYLSYAVLIINDKGQCEVFPSDFDSFKEDKGQHVTVLEGYSDRALKRPAPSPTPGRSTAPK